MTQVQDTRQPPAEALHFLSEREKAGVAALQREFEDEFSKRSAEGRLHPCFFGEVALARVCRGCDHDPNQCNIWFRRFLKVADESNLDGLVLELTQKLEESGLPLGDNDILPHYDEVKQYARSVYAAPKLSSEGDIVTYTAMQDQNKHGALAGLDWDHFVKFNRALVVQRCIDVDRLSREQGRSAQVIWLWDLEACSMDTIFVGSFDKMFDRDVGKFAESISAEIIGKFYVVNAPWAISTLWSMAKVFLPEQLAKKTVLVSGDGLRDDAFVESVGGEEQLLKLYSTKVGLIMKGGHYRHVEMLDCMPTDAERENIAKLRARFEDEFEKRRAQGRDWPCFFGDIALLRVLRGNDGHLRTAVEWFKSFLAKVEEHDIDSIAQEMIAKMDESRTQFGNYSMLPHVEEIRDYNRFIFTAPRLTPEGDVVSYMPMADHDRAGLVANIQWEKWVRFVLSICVLRCVELDRLSRIQQRVVRFISLIDTEASGVSIYGLPSVPEYDARFKAEVEPILFEISIDVLRASHIMNAPWLAVKAYNCLKMFVPEKITNKIHLIDGDGLSDPGFVKAVGGETQLRQLIASRLGLVAGTAEDAGKQDVAAGDVFQRNCDVQAGLRVEWNFSIGSGVVDDWLGRSDLEFSVTALWFPEISTLAEEAARAASEGLIEGSLGFDGAGGFVRLVGVPNFETFTWSAWVRPAPENWSEEHIFIRRPNHVAFNVLSGNLVLWLYDGYWHSALTATWDPAFADTWHHLTASYDGEAARLFVNGELLASAEVDIELLESEDPIFIGAGLDDGDRHFFKGQITEVCLYDVARSSEEIRSSMQARVNPNSEVGLVGYAQLCFGVDLIPHQGLLWRSVGEVQPLSHNGGSTFASEQTPFADTEKRVAVAEPPRDSVWLPEEVVVSSAMVYCGKEVSGAYECSRNGIMTFKWSNAHSRIRSKALRYTVEVKQAGVLGKVDSVEDFAECDEGEVSAEEEPGTPGKPSPALDAVTLAALDTRVEQKLNATAGKEVPQVLAACAVADLAMLFQADGQLVYRLDE